MGLDYVSCSPFRVPIARLAAAQAAIRNKLVLARHRTADFRTAGSAFFMRSGITAGSADRATAPGRFRQGPVVKRCSYVHNETQRP